MWHWILAILALPMVVSAQPAPPAAAERERVLRTVSEFARGYLDRLPDFVCLRATQHLMRDPGSSDWKPQIRISNELTYYRRQEHYRVVAVNDAPAKKTPRLKHWVGSGGDFGGFLQTLFEPGSRAKFEWKGWETVRGRHAFALSYSMPAGYVISDCSSVLFMGTCKSAEHPYHGALYLAEDTLEVMRLTVEPENVPQNRESRSIDYDRVAIAGKDYLLPIADTFERVKDKVAFRNESVYHNYRKFTADSTIKLAPDGDRY